ncbi:hypothetical protein TNCV_4714131 [Trichonephila clavipes]|nr:hypothetical protein TNCV_4714131 [Trichonephila clavipes]
MTKTMPQNLLEHVSASYLLLRLVGYQSSWRSTEDFQYTRPHLLGRSLSLVFLALRPGDLTGSAIWRRGSVTTYCWGSASRGTWRKTARVWSAYFFFSANVVEVPSAVSSCQRQPFSLGSSALHVPGRRPQ